jgi:hypothetical protein
MGIEALPPTTQFIAASYIQAKGQIALATSFAQ